MLFFSSSSMQAIQTLTINMGGEMLGSGYEYNMLIKSVPETELWKLTYVTAVLNVGWCGEQKRERGAVRKGDYK